MFETINAVFIAVGSRCSIAGWGYINKNNPVSSTLQWAEVPTRNTTECRVESFITFLREDLRHHYLTDSNVLLVKRLDIKTPSFFIYFFFVKIHLI